MKMGAGVFWGVILILVGLGIVIRVVFNIDFPIFKFLVALFFIYIGLRIMFGSFGLFHFKVDKNDIVFNEKHVEATIGEDEYNVIFGKGIFDFRDIDISDGPVKFKVNTIFGASEIKVNKDMPLKIVADAVFAGAELPEGNTAVFGSNTYTNEKFVEDSSYLFIKIDVVFGGVEVKTYE